MSDDSLGFAEPHDRPVPYMQRLTDYYLALGYGNPYRWANYADVPFTSLAKPLSRSKLMLVTTAAPYKVGAGDQGPRAKYNAAAKFYNVFSDYTAEDRFLGVSHIGIDRKYTTAEDMNTFFPLPALRNAGAAGRIGGLTERFIGTPTNRSHKTTIEQDCADVWKITREDNADVALLVPN